MLLLITKTQALFLIKLSKFVELSIFKNKQE